METDCPDLPAELLEIFGYNLKFPALSITHIEGNPDAAIDAIIFVSPERDWSKDSRLLRIFRHHTKCVWGVYLDQPSHLALQRMLAGGLPNSNSKRRRDAFIFLDSNISVWRPKAESHPNDNAVVMSYDLAPLMSGVRNVTMVTTWPHDRNGALPPLTRLKTSTPNDILTHASMLEAQEELVCMLLLANVKPPRNILTAARHDNIKIRAESSCVVSCQPANLNLEAVNSVIAPDWKKFEGFTPFTGNILRFKNLGPVDLFMPSLWGDKMKCFLGLLDSQEQAKLLQNIVQQITIQNEELDLFRAFPAVYVSRQGCQGNVITAILVARWLGIRARPIFAVDVSSGFWHWWIEILDSKNRRWTPYDISIVPPGAPQIASDSPKWWRRATLMAIFALDDKAPDGDVKLGAFNVTANYLPTVWVTNHLDESSLSNEVAPINGLCAQHISPNGKKPVGPFLSESGVVFYWDSVAERSDWITEVARHSNYFTTNAIFSDGARKFNCHVP